VPHDAVVWRRETPLARVLLARVFGSGLRSVVPHEPHPEVRRFIPTSSVRGPISV